MFYYVIPLMISNEEKREQSKTLARRAKPEGRQRWHYLPVKRLSALSRGITSKHNGDFYCLNCIRSFRTKNKLEFHKTVI